MQFYLRDDYMQKPVRYNYPINYFSGLDALSQPNTLPLTYCSYGYNIGFRNGALTNSMGIEYAKINDNILPNVGLMARRIFRCWIYFKYNYTTQKREDEIVALLDNGAIFTTLLDGGTKFMQTTITFPPNTAVSGINYHLDGQDVFLIFGSQGGMYLYNGQEAIFYEDIPGFNSICMHYERIYGTTEEGANRLYFSDDLDPTNWQQSLTEGGYITFPDGEGGRVKKVLSFNDYVFIFRENGIHRLTAYTDLTEYKLTKVFSTSNKIIANTIQICGDKIVFLAEDGIYSFDGFTARRIYREILPIIDDKKYSVACYFDYKYYLATNIIRDENRIGDETEMAMKNNAIIAIDFDLKNVEILRGADIKSFLPINTADICQLIVAFNNFRSPSLGMLNCSGRIMERPLKKIWQSPKTNFSKLDGDKIIRRIYLSTNQPLTLTIEADDTIVTEINPSTRIQMIPINRKAEEISIKIETNSDKLFLNSLLVEFDVIRRRYDNG